MDVTALMFLIMLYYQWATNKVKDGKSKIVGDLDGDQEGMDGSKMEICVEYVKWDSILILEMEGDLINIKMVE